MNILEALKSRRRFRIKSEFPSDFYTPQEWIQSYIIKRTSVMDEENQGYLLRDLLSDEYELEELEVKLTTSQFWAAANQVIAPEDDDAKIMPELAKLLGVAT